MYSVDEILSEFRSQYAEPENETVEQELQQAAPEQGGEVLQEEEKKDDFEEETASWSVRDILRDYRRMTMESRLAEEKIPEENNRTEEHLPAPTADWKETEPAQEIKPAFRFSTKPKPKAEAKPESRAEAEPKSEPRAGAGPKTEPKPEAESTPETGSEAHAESAPETVVEATPEPSYLPLDTPKPSEVPKETRYEIVLSDENWTTVKEYADHTGGHLVVINSEEEYRKVVELAELKGVTYVWIGGRRVDGAMTWLDGTAVEQNDPHWCEGEPTVMDNGSPEDYLILIRKNGSWGYNDIIGNPAELYPDIFGGKIAYVIEIES